MTVSEWHLDRDSAQRYADGDVTPALASSVEQHLIACPACRAMLAPAVDAARLDRVWSEVVERVVAPRAGVLERLLRQFGVTESTARLIAVTPSLRADWLSAVTGLLVVSLLVAHTGPHGIAFFFALAPLLPMLGVAAAFAPNADPMRDMVLSTPYDNFRLLLARAIAVVTSTLALVLIAGFLLPESRWLAVSWLLPALALCVVTLAAAPRIQPVQSAASLTVLWLILALPALRPRADPLLATHAAVQLVSLLAFAAGAIVLLQRQRSLPARSRRSS
jgi:predicted anti-sigma-YlaC factor YlaD